LLGSLRFALRHFAKSTGVTLGHPNKRMKLLPASAIRPMFATLLFCCTARAADAAASSTWQEKHDQLVQRLRNLSSRENAFGAAYRPLYHAALPWYELWGGRDQNPVDDDMVPPEAYADELAGSLEQGRNYFAENPNALFPLVFQRTLPNGKAASANYWIKLPAGFPAGGRAFPLVIDLHGAGWLGHKISLKLKTKPSDPTFDVTPINMGGPWKTDFLNAYLDELLAILPVDRDRVYVQGHSLGAMATWEWALDNPERFAAISPRSGIGEPYRASRLKNVPSWVIHGENDNVIPSGFADQMVTALESHGASARFSIIKGGGHSMPPDLDQRQVVDWFLRQTRSHLPPPPDPRDGLGLDASGFSPWEIITLPARPSWKSQPVAGQGEKGLRDAAKALFQKVHDRGELVDSPIRWEMDLKTHLTTFWLEIPQTLHPSGLPDPSAVVLPECRFVRFFFRGEIKLALDHLPAIKADVISRGHTLSENLWYTPLALWQNTPGAIAECWVETN
jgi:pimeloyl-ACP methyl ester carboxylesterase